MISAGGIAGGDCAVRRRRAAGRQEQSQCQDTYGYQSDYEEIRPFKEFTDIHDVAPILVHHTRKNTESENSFDRISGTNGLLGAADGAFLLYREKGRVILDQTGKDLPGQRMILDFDPQRCLWTVVSREAEIAEPPEPLLDLIDQVIGGGWQGTATELLERLRRLDPELPYLSLIHI